MERMERVKGNSRKAVKLLSTVATVAALLVASIPAVNSSAVEKGSIELSVDKKIANVGEIITSTLKINNIPNFVGYDVNIVYDKNVLQPVKLVENNYLGYMNQTEPEEGDLLLNAKFSPLVVAFNDVDAGYLNFGGTYVRSDLYKKSGLIETTGTLGVIKFKVLKKTKTTLCFQDTRFIPNGINGTALYALDDKQVTDYDIYDPGVLFVNATSTPRPVYTAKPTIKSVPEDINGDKSVNMMDVILIAKCFNKISTDTEFDARCDLNSDGSINMIDVIQLAKRFNYTY